MTPLAAIADAWAEVGATRSRRTKTAVLAAVLRDLDADELAAGTAMLAGEPRQGRIGVGWRTVGAVDVPPADVASLTVLDVDRALDEIAGMSGAGSQAARRAALEDLFARATAAEQEHLRGLLLGNLRQGALEGVVVAAVAEAAEVDVDAVRRAAMLTGDVTVAAVTAMTAGLDGLAAFRLTLFRPVQPMLAQSAPDVPAAVERTGNARVETKLDGMRIQVHRDGDRVEVYTRGLRRVTDGLPAVVAATRALDVQQVILDGEALALDGSGRPLPFQESMQSTGDAEMTPWFFDILHADGEDLIDQPLHARTAVLERVVPADLRVGVTTTEDPEAGTDHLRRALAAGHEGVVVKALDAPYEAGRRGASWVKVKVAHTLDLVVLAVEWGSGRRQGWLSNIHLGALDEETGEFVMLGKTFKGMTDELLAWQTEQFLAREVSRDGHVVHVRPELVVEIAIDGVQASRRYPGGVALRFARVKGYRDDKRPDEVDTLQTVQAIHRGEITPAV